MDPEPSTAAHTPCLRAAGREPCTANPSEVPPKKQADSLTGPSLLPLAAGPADDLEALTVAIASVSIKQQKRTQPTVTPASAAR